ncbi:AFG1-family ATPase [Luminiphilus syltensis NOR5-1B]|uniref:Cell division protein ZapE n=1 Tax=Luminiphilus syltensis NOR5-1B TaxID=565045 RepID=B8KR72_9GAMM|nr:cell division protein ZapE [Luminiphilus syltensis]EED36541.1 AFG1-family ATPase [Luminiphilus syltensis NOR5-1B]
MTPKQRYLQDLERPDFVRDEAQANAVAHLDALYQRLVERDATDQGIARKLWRLTRGPRPPETGLYFWGGVGRGKTYLVDTFFDSLPFERKLRVHFHRFMQRVHHDLTALAGEKNPLELIADRVASEALVICFDEFFVSDIADAMLLGGLMEALFERGVTLVATSNITPDLLYKDGLQRARFLPAIELIKNHTLIVNVDSGVDYRLRTLEQAEIFHAPLDSAAQAALEHSFRALANGAEGRPGEIEINNRTLKVLHEVEGMAWFDFDELCRKPRSASDFVELARIYGTVLIEGVRQMDSAADDAMRRFINLVDEFYDRNVKLILTAEVSPEALYSGQRLTFEFQRTLSRLLEMQSKEYLAREHRP